MKLYVLISNGGDGSYNPLYVLDQKVIDLLEDAYNDDKLDYECAPGVDGDGFHYGTITVPDDSTAESLGLSRYSIFSAKDFSLMIEENESE